DEQAGAVVAWIGSERGVDPEALATELHWNVEEMSDASGDVPGWLDSDPGLADAIAGLQEALDPLLAKEETDEGRAAVIEAVVTNDDALADWVGEQADGVPRLTPVKVKAGERKFFEVAILLVAIGGVSWLTMARVIRGQVLSLKSQPFMEAARAIGVPVHRQFLSHLLPNLLGPIIVYTTLTVPQAILQESFLSFLGIGVRPPLPSWGNLAAEGLIQLNPVDVRWWLILFPCLLLGLTLLALNFVGEGLREAFDPKRAKK
ncbi:MAG: ABC transporter permease, partial [Phycisphaerales bacterium]|nr:ABC transporter permease [Phycisphaerales bacterium]